MPAGVYPHKPHSAETRAKMSRSHLGKNTWSLGNKNAWKGDAVGYHGIHKWIASVLGAPSGCENCGRTDDGTRYEWANLSGEYLRDISDWARLCARCHRLIDNSGRGVKIRKDRA